MGTGYFAQFGGFPLQKITDWNGIGLALFFSCFLILLRLIPSGLLLWISLCQCARFLMVS